MSRDREIAETDSSSNHAQKLCVGKILNVVVTSHMSIKNQPVVHKITTKPLESQSILTISCDSMTRTSVKAIQSVVINGSGAVFTKLPVSGLTDGSGKDLLVSRYTTERSVATSHLNETVHILQKISDVSVIAESTASDRIIKVKNIKEILIVSQIVKNVDCKKFSPPRKPKRGLFKSQTIESAARSQSLTLAHPTYRVLKRSKSAPLYPTIIKVSRINKRNVVDKNDFVATTPDIASDISSMSSSKGFISFCESHSNHSPKTPKTDSIDECVLLKSVSNTSVHDSSSFCSSPNKKSADSNSNSKNSFKIFQQRGSVSNTSTLTFQTSLDKKMEYALMQQLNESFDSLKRKSTAESLKSKASSKRKPPKHPKTGPQQLKRTFSLTSPISPTKPSIALKVRDKKYHDHNVQRIHLAETVETIPLIHNSSLTRPSKQEMDSPKKSLSLPRKLSLKAKQRFSLRSTSVHSRPSLKLPTKLSFKKENYKKPNLPGTDVTKPAVIPELDVVYNFSERLNKNVRFDAYDDLDPETSFVELSCMPGRSNLAFTRDDSRFLDPALRDELKHLELFYDSADDFPEENSVTPKENSPSTSSTYPKAMRNSSSHQSLESELNNTLKSINGETIGSCYQKGLTTFSYDSKFGRQNFPKLDVVYDRREGLVDEFDDSCLTEYVILSRKDDEFEFEKHKTFGDTVAILENRNNRKSRRLLAVRISRQNSQGSIKIPKLPKIMRSKSKGKNVIDVDTAQKAQENDVHDPNVGIGMQAM